MWVDYTLKVPNDGEWLAVLRVTDEGDVSLVDYLMDAPEDLERELAAIQQRWIERSTWPGRRRDPAGRAHPRVPQVSRGARVAMPSSQNEESGAVYDDGQVQLWNDDCRLFIADAMQGGMGHAFLVTDPPYGIKYESGAWRVSLPNSIVGDDDTSMRDWVLDAWGDGPALVFGSWKVERPAKTHTKLIWDTKGANGMGDLSVPWKPSHQEIYVLGHGFEGHRGTDVYSIAPVQSTARNGRVHPHQKPVPLMRALLAKIPADALIFDPFAGSGSTLVAAAEMGRRAVGVEVEPLYCQIAAHRLKEVRAARPLFDAETAA